MTPVLESALVDFLTVLTKLVRIIAVTAEREGKEAQR